MPKLMINVTSPAFKPGQKIPQKYTCDGLNSSPPLKISGVPDEAKSLAIIVDDPDASTGNFNHWIMWNIKPDIKEIPENSIVLGAVSGLNDAGENGYIGPCPPSGTHRYVFKVYALGTELDLPDNAKKK